jgi:rhamnogalacturonyl hydrolase YesR
LAANTARTVKSKNDNMKTQTPKLAEYRWLLVLIILLPALKTYAQTAEEVLQTTMKVADKIIRETSFEYTNEILVDNLWSQFLVEAPDNKSYLAKGSLVATEQRESILGLSFEGNISVYINRENVFSGVSTDVKLLEYTYGRFRPQESISIQLEKGINDILVICRGSANVLMLPIDDVGESGSEASFGNMTAGPIESQWLVSGPYDVSESEDLLQLSASQPKLNYTSGGKFWSVPSLPLARQLTIPEQASFQKHPYAEWHYANGGTMLGILNLYKVSDDQKYFDFVSQFTEFVRENREYDRWQFENIPVLRGAQYRLFRMTMLDDSGGPALPFMELKKSYGAEEYDEILERVLKHVTEEQDRLPDGTLCRSEPETNTIWGDDLFMSTPFLCRMALATGNDKLFDDVARQIIQFNNYLMNPETGLYFHGYYADRNEAAPFQWGRANGWVTWAMSEALMLMPQEHEKYQDVLSIYKSHIAAIAGYQNENGLWHQILTEPSTYEETSCTAMYTLSMARGINYGWLDDSFRKNVLAGWRAVSDKIADDGTVSKICRGTGIGESVEFYNGRETFDHDPRGLGAVLTAGSEVYEMLKK